MRISTLSATIDTLPAMAWAISADGRERYLNGRAAGFLGVDPADFERLSCCDLMHPGDAALVERAGRNYALGREFRFDCRMRHAEGGFRWVSATVGPVRDEQATLLGWVGILSDIQDFVDGQRRDGESPAIVALTGEQIRAARALCRWEQTQLAGAAGVSLETVKRLEAFRGPVEATTRTVASLVQAFERAGVVFDLRAGTGPGLRLAETRASG